MTEVQQTRPSTRQRLLQVAAVVSALSIVGSYVVWSQHQAGQRAKLKQQAEKASAPEARNTGVTPQVGPDGDTIDLDLVPEVVEFEGFVNYGGPVSAEGSDSLGSPVVRPDGLAASSKSISMPIFTTRTEEENEAPEIDPRDLISGSKSGAHVPVTSLESPGPVVLWEGSNVPAEDEAPVTDPDDDASPDADYSAFGVISGSKSIGVPLSLPKDPLKQWSSGRLSLWLEESSEPDSESQ